MPGKLKVKIVAGRHLPVMDRASDLTDAFVEVGGRGGALRPGREEEESGGGGGGGPAARFASSPRTCRLAHGAEAPAGLFRGDRGREEEQGSHRPRGAPPAGRPRCGDRCCRGHVCCRGALPGTLPAAAPLSSPAVGRVSSLRSQPDRCSAVCILLRGGDRPTSAGARWVSTARKRPGAPWARARRGVCKAMFVLPLGVSFSWQSCRIWMSF